MPQVAIISADHRIEELLRPSGLKVATLGEQALSSFSGEQAPSAVLVDLRGQQRLSASVAAYRRQHPDSAVVLLRSSLDGRMMLEAIRAGVSECVAEPFTSATLEEAVRRVLTAGAADAPGQVLAFVGAKGGVGTTTLAVNTAATLARVGDGDVLLVDLHIGHGDAAIFLGVEPRFSVVDALENVHRIDDELVRSMVEKTKPGIDLLASSDRSIAASIEPERMRALLEYAIRRYRFTVLDVPRADVAMLDVLDSVSAIVVVASQELSALRNAARLGHSLTQRYGAARVRVVVSRFNPRSELGEREVEKVVGSAVAHLIPSDYATAVEALNTGRPVVMDKDQRLARALRTFATELAGVVKQERERPAGLLGRLTLRRA